MDNYNDFNEYTNEHRYESVVIEKPKKKRFGVTLLKCVALALVFGLVSGGVFYGMGMLFPTTEMGQESQKDPTIPTLNDKVTTTTTTTTIIVSDVSEVVENVTPAIVAVSNVSVHQIQGWFGQNYTQESTSAGSGIIVAQTEKYLYIVTNNHVVENSTTLTVTFANGESYEAEIKGTDYSTDLAVIMVSMDKISKDTLQEIKVATLGKSENLKVGEPAIAIGNALGYGQSVTTGVISALDREVTLTDGNGNKITNKLIQTDAAINPGNSGGALLNIKGEVIGINSAKYSDTDVEGMGFAIPISTADPIINDLISKEKVEEAEKGYLGIAGVDVTDEYSQQLNLPKGVYIGKVEKGSAAEQAGLKVGDIITTFDGRTISTMDELSERIQYCAAGTTVEITYMRANDGEYEEHTISVTLGKRK